MRSMFLKTNFVFEGLKLRFFLSLFSIKPFQNIEVFPLKNIQLLKMKIIDFFVYAVIILNQNSELSFLVTWWPFPKKLYSQKKWIAVYQYQNKYKV